MQGWKPRDFAHELGISTQYLADIELGRRHLNRRPDLIKQMAGVLRIPVTKLYRSECGIVTVSRIPRLLTVADIAAAFTAERADGPGRDPRRPPQGPQGPWCGARPRRRGHPLDARASEGLVTTRSFTPIDRHGPSKPATVTSLEPLLKRSAQERITALRTAACHAYAESDRLILEANAMAQEAKRLRALALLRDEQADTLSLGLRGLW